MRMIRSKLAYLRENVSHAFKREEGTVTVEFAIMAPLLAGFYCAMFVWFDAYRQKTLIMKSSYAISDVFSRQVEVDEPFMNNMLDMLDYMIPSHAKPRMRVSLVEFNQNVPETNKHRLRWSYGPNGMADLTQLDLDNDSTWLPIMSHLDAVVVVETAVLYQPIFRVGISPKVHRNTFVTRPRFHVTLKKTDEPAYATNFPDEDNYGDGDPTAGGTPTN